MRIAFTVAAIPKAQPRQRHRVINGKDGKAFATNYTPAKDPVNAYKAQVRMAFADAYKGPPLTGPIRLTTVFRFPRPKGMIWKKRPMPAVWHTKKPDRDNLEKSTKDALHGLAWIDDSQVCAGEPFKVTCSGDEQPGVRIIIEVIDSQELPSVCRF